MPDAVRGTHQGAAPRDAPSSEAGDAPSWPILKSVSTPRRQVAGVAMYLLVSFGLCWLACLPLWMGPGLSDAGLVAICGGIAMFTPAIAALFVVRVVERRSWRRSAPRRSSAADGRTSERVSVLGSLGLRGRAGAGRFMGALAVGMTAPVVLLVASQLLAAAFGTFDLDLTLRQAVVDLELPAETPLAQVWLAFGGRLILAMLLGGTINVILALGEEIGWRGYLMPRIHQLWGLPAAIIAGGVIWGLWHAPLILLGYNYPDAAPWAGQLAMIAACTVVGGFFYLLAVTFGSVWPAALAHGVNNAVSSLLMTSLLVPGMEIDTVNGSALGWPGWIVYGAVVIVGFAVLRRRRPAHSTSATTGSSEPQSGPA